MYILNTKDYTYQTIQSLGMNFIQAQDYVHNHSDVRIVDTKTDLMEVLAKFKPQHILNEEMTVEQIQKSFAITSDNQVAENSKNTTSIEELNDKIDKLIKMNELLTEYIIELKASHINLIDKFDNLNLKPAKERKPRSDEHKEKIRLALQGKQNRLGKPNKNKKIEENNEI